ncbi:MAG: FtsW/RodA/SpoVE family cell cycle protein [Planctomycetaceae bacterium]|nr:FtsW/RodA/SpoVE family cell cycle protein [Planctomycetaceae bacterium]
MKLPAWTRRLPWSIVVAAVLLNAIGLAAIARVEELTDGAGRFLHQQAAYSVLALAIMLLLTVPNYQTIGRYSYAIFAAALLLLVAVYWHPPINEARRWIRLGPVGIQPSEFAKVAYVLALARYLMHRDNYRRLRGLLGPLLLTLLPVVLVLREPDLGSSSVFLPVFFVMLFAAGAKRRDLACVLAVGVLLLPLLWTQMNPDQRSRVVSLFDQPQPGQMPSRQAYQLYQAKQLRAMGGAWGSWIASQPTDDPAAYRLPEAQSDFIFAVVGERFGLPGTALMLLLFAWIVGRAVAIAQETREPFGRLLAVGVATLFAIETLIHAGVTVGLLPITGISLPLVSHGGSGLLAHALALGLLLNVGLRPGYEMVNEPFRYVVNPN